MEDIRSFNVGASDYAKHLYQSWDFWIKFALNPFDADLCKRILRTKKTDGRLLDYQKIKHIMSERIRQLETGPDTWGLPKHVDYDTFVEMVKDYHLIQDDFDMLNCILYPSSATRSDDYKKAIEICDKRILEFTKG